MNDTADHHQPAPEPLTRYVAWVNGAAFLLPDVDEPGLVPLRDDHDTLVRRKLGNMDTLEVFEVPMRRVPLKSTGAPAAEQTQSGSGISHVVPLHALRQAASEYVGDHAVNIWDKLCDEVHYLNTGIQRGEVANVDHRRAQRIIAGYFKGYREMLTRRKDSSDEAV
jgi:hypothetical protein